MYWGERKILEKKGRKKKNRNATGRGLTTHDRKRMIKNGD
jgi:hypothetical protein